ncbi:MAG TPA: ABC transporter permease [Actinomycetota bacterium]|nr:ABC transporter permease [Actinomycetota bacterium]
MSLSRRLAAFLLTPLGALLLLAVIVPLAMLFAFSFFHINELLQIVPGFTAGNYRQVVTTSVYRVYAVNTLLIAAPTAIASIVGGYVLAYYLAFRAGRARGILLVAIVIALMGSYLALIYSWRTLSGEHGIINSLLQAAHVTRGPLGLILFSRTAVVIAETNFFLPFTTLVLYSSLSSIPPSLEAAARDLGASRWMTLRRIVFPLSGTALFGATLFVFFLSAGDYITPVFLGGIGSSGTFGTLIADQLSTTLNYPLGASIAFVMLALFAAVVVLLRLGMRAAGLLPEHTG